MPEDLAQVLADARGEAAVLRRRGHSHEADAIEDLCDRVARAAEDFLKFVPESDALLRGCTRAYLRRNFPGWEADGNARKVNGRREYRSVMLPRAVPASVAREAGLRGERPPRQRKAS